MDQAMTAPPLDWLLAAEEPWVRYWTLRDLVGRPANDPEVQVAHQATLDHPGVQALLADLADWPGPALKRHNDATHHLHKLAALAGFGLTADDAALQPVLARILDGQSPEGAFTVSLQVAERYGGDGQPHRLWMLCDAPVTLGALLAFGLGDDPRVRRALNHVLGLVRDNGWPCVSAADFGGFRGPGRKDDPCPYATLVALRAISRVLGLVESDMAEVAASAGVEALLHHWAIRRERKLYLFGIGTDFHKPKYPLIWYDILHLTDVLSRFPQARADDRFHQMLAALMAQADEAGRFTAGSMYRPWKDWDFADKKAPSPTITCTAWRTYHRAGGL